MANKFFFSRDTKVSVKLGTGVFDVPVLDGFSFSQAQNIQDITFNEAADASGNSSRGRETVVSSLAPAEWSFSTYIRPFKTLGTDVAGNADRNGGANKHHLVEEVLWALLAGADTYTDTSGSADPAFQRSSSDVIAFSTSASGSTINFGQSNKTTLGTADFEFILNSGDTSEDKVYKITECVVNEVTIDFDLDGIATAQWSGFGTLITDEASTPTATTVSEDATATDNMIRNRLSAVTITGASPSQVYDITLTGGSITISNNITYLTPETLGQVNTPLGHVTGTRTVTGTLNCYLNNESAAANSTGLFEDMVEDNKSSRKTSFDVALFIGGETGSGVLNGPGMKITMPTCHFEIPTHNFDDIISLETAFHALPSTHDGTNEISAIDFKGA
jgi:hypothetical protein